MRRKPLNTISRSKLSKYAKPLANLASLLADSGSRTERRFWKKKLFAALAPLLLGRSDTTLVQTLDYLFDHNYAAYDELAFSIENSVESPPLGDGSKDILMLAVPILAWSTYHIPSGTIDVDTLQQITQQLKKQVLTEHVELVLTDILFSPDQLPESYNEAAYLARQLGEAVLNDNFVHIDLSTLPETQGFLSDVRYLIGAISAPKDSAVFKWQVDDAQHEENSSPLSKDEVLDDWRNFAGQIFQSLLPGCKLELLLPNGLYKACREAEKSARGYSVKASAAFLHDILGVPIQGITATVGAFVDRGEIEEYRIGFALQGKRDVVHGVVWPLIGSEYGNEPDPVYEKDIQSAPDNPVIRNTIETLLKQVGFGTVRILEERFSLEYCEDCGAPLYPNPEGDLMHAELPEELNGPDLQVLH